MRIISNDWIPMCEDAGFDELIESLAPRMLDGDVFVAELNTESQLVVWTTDMLVQYIAARHLSDALQSVIVTDYGRMPTAQARSGAPTSLGADTAGVWFGTPDTETKWVRWYVNGSRAAREERDLSSNRYIALSAIGAQSGDVVQIAIEDNDVVGWWARITV